MALIGILIVALLLVAGVVLLSIGLRGHLVSKHPHCRRCRFDLIGQAADGAWPGKVCPECGAHLGPARSVRSGLRVRRRVPTWSGVVVLVLAGAGAASLVWGNLQGKGLYSHFPTWAILVAMDRVQGDELDLISLELRARSKAGDLTAAQKSSAIAACLRAQEDRKRTWAYQCGKFVEDERSLGVVTDAIWLKYLGNAMLLDCNARPTIVRDEVLPLELVMHDRMGRSGAVTVRIRLVDVLLDGKRIDGERQALEITPIDSWGQLAPPLEPVAMMPQVIESEQPWYIRTPREEPRVRAEPGTHTVETVWGVVAGDNRRPGTFSGLSMWRCQTTPPGEQTPRPSDDEVLRQMKIEWVRDAWFDPISAKYLISQSQVSAAETERLAAKLVHLTTTINVTAAPPSTAASGSPTISPLPPLTAERFLNTFNRPPVGPPAQEESVSIVLTGSTTAFGVDVFELSDGTERLLGSLCIDSNVPGNPAGSRAFRVRVPRAIAADQARSFVLRPREELARRLVHPEPRLTRPVYFLDVPAPPAMQAAGEWAPGVSVPGVAEPPARR